MKGREEGHDPTIDVGGKEGGGCPIAKMIFHARRVVASSQRVRQQARRYRATAPRSPTPPPMLSVSNHNATRQRRQYTPHRPKEPAKNATICTFQLQPSLDTTRHHHWVRVGRNLDETSRYKTILGGAVILREVIRDIFVTFRDTGALAPQVQPLCAPKTAICPPREADISNSNKNYTK